MVPVGDEVCLPFPVLDSRVLRLWRWPRALVGGEALGKALCEKKKARSGASTPRTDRDWGDAREGVDVEEEVSVPITPTTFDRKKKVPERHSLRYGGSTRQRLDWGLFERTLLVRSARGNIFLRLRFPRWRRRIASVFQGSFVCSCVCAWMFPPLVWRFSPRSWP